MCGIPNDLLSLNKINKFKRKTLFHGYYDYFMSNIKVRA